MVLIKEKALHVYWSARLVRGRIQFKSRAPDLPKFFIRNKVFFPLLSAGTVRETFIYFMLRRLAFCQPRLNPHALSRSLLHSPSYPILLLLSLAGDLNKTLMSCYSNLYVYMCV